MRTEVVDFKRKDLFKAYDMKENPFLYVTTKVDITNIYNKCKKYYATISSQIFKKLKEDVTIYENQKSFSTYYGYLS